MELSVQPLKVPIAKYLCLVLSNISHLSIWVFTNSSAKDRNKTHGDCSKKSQHPEKVSNPKALTETLQHGAS